MKIRYKKLEFIYVMFVLSTMVLTFAFRDSIWSLFGRFNLFFIIALIYLLYIYKNKIFVNDTLLIVLLIVHSTLINFIAGNNAKEILASIVINFVPLLLLIVDWSKIDYFKKKSNLKTVIILMNNIFIILISIYVVDLVAGKAIMNFIGSLIPNISLNLSGQTTRFVSWFGHPLNTCLIIIIWYTINQVYSITFNERLINEKFLLAMFLVGIVSVQSKAGFIIMLISVIYFSLIQRKNSIAKTFGIILVFSFVLFSGGFNLILDRVGSTIDFSSGRLYSLNMILQMKAFEFKFLGGYGYSIVTESYNATGIGKFNNMSGYGFFGAAELPLFVHILRYGILSALLTWYVLFFQFWKYLNSKMHYIPISVMFVFLFINTFNGLWSCPDDLQIYVFFVSIILQIQSCYVEAKRMVEV